MIPRPPTPTLFPYTTLFRSSPIRKVDPKYPPTLINEHVEGEVVLYAVIRGDGSVDSIQLVRGIDDELDRKSTRLNSSHTVISYAVFCLKKKKKKNNEDNYKE